MEDPPTIAEFASVAFLLLLGGTRYRYSRFARTRPAVVAAADCNGAKQVPAYAVSAAWTLYVAWLALAPARLVEWDRWPLDSAASAAIAWAALAPLAASAALFWWSHHVIGNHWSLRIEIKRGHRLVTNGPYAYVRHPLYTALFLGYLGTLLSLQSWTLAGGFAPFIAAYLLFAAEEERVMARRFGEEYSAYRRRTGRFLPRWGKARAVSTLLKGG
jgi:protein-S-isoprenylcysteine O-methyltransferase Ste14